MTTKKPSTATNTTGAYSYKSGVSSNTFNYIDNTFPNLLDKTGDNSTTTPAGGITGFLEMLSGSSLVLDSGAVISLTGSSVLAANNSSEVIFNNTSTLELNDTSTMITGSGTSMLVGGILNITSGGTFNLNSTGNMHIKSGANFYIDNGGTETVSNGGTVAVASGANVNYASGSNLNLNAGSFLNLTGTTVQFTNGGGSPLFTVGSGCLVDFLSGSFLTAASGSTTNIHGTFKTDSFPVWNTPITRQSCMVIKNDASAQGAADWQNVGTGMKNTNGASPQILGQQTLEVPLNRLHNGATLASIFIAFAVGTTHSGVPANLPYFTVYRYQSLGGAGPAVVQYLSTSAVQQPANPGSGSAWYNSGGIQYYQYVTDQNNVIDNTNWLYGLTIVDESGTNSLGGNIYFSVTAENQIITDTSWNI